MAVSSEKVGGLVSEIAAASSEQAQGIDQVNQAMTQMDQVVQQTAANSEEAAAAAEELNSQALAMKGMVEELTAMVNGNGRGKKALVQAHAQSGRPALPKAPEQPRRLESTTEMRPDEVIPLDEGSLADF